MMTAREYLRKKLAIEMPEGNINGSWFAENGIPMIVSCSCCDSTMALPSALIDEEDFIYCPSCVSE